MAQLSFNSIGRTYGEFTALSDVNLEIGSGEFICLLGPSGCGKTTLLRILAGLETTTRGAVHLNGEDFSNVPCHQRNIGMVFQSLALFPHLSVGENIAYGLDVRGVDKKARHARAEELTALVGLPGLSDRPVSALSGGQRQRVAIARALAIEPVLFLMDEPFSALDAGLREHLQIEVKKLQRKLGVTTLFVTHDQNEAMSIADRIVILNDGVIEQAGTPTEVYARPQSEFVANFMGTNNVLDVEFVPGADVIWNGISLGRPSGEMATLSGKRKLSVRPEYLQLAPVGTTGTGMLGTVEFVRLLGAQVETELTVAGHRIIDTMISDRPPAFGEGDRAEILIKLDHAWVIPS
ncbi:ABC transporter ATP-binding protein [Tropicimonas sp. TH_r6]|uniref:ABC transporter ATP-binding protein n=1 Tax=Tropicimonas sp. TH_r6 TaxID=3082085 RepID=UPI0029551177|nr:ABC transporter ATP-binding protein [Tropicimonas sp. TH_r6]MDV7145621.1 ABC transporter ATP-binding protein [Tropicimonas sp. TH_r6]